MNTASRGLTMAARRLRETWEPAICSGQPAPDGSSALGSALSGAGGRSEGAADAPEDATEVPAGDGFWIGSCIPIGGRMGRARFVRSIKRLETELQTERQLRRKTEQEAAGLRSGIVRGPASSPRRTAPRRSARNASAM
jgi:hypothetical protein